jgi:hypothetical protein
MPEFTTTYTKADHREGDELSASGAACSGDPRGDWAEGRGALKRLHETGAVRDPEARYELSVLARHGYWIY